MKDWHKMKPELFKKQPYHLPGCDSYDQPRHAIHRPLCIPRQVQPFA